MDETLLNLRASNARSASEHEVLFLEMQSGISNQEVQMVRQEFPPARSQESFLRQGLFGELDFLSTRDNGKEDSAYRLQGNGQEDKCSPHVQHGISRTAAKTDAGSQGKGCKRSTQKELGYTAGTGPAGVWRAGFKWERSNRFRGVPIGPVSTSDLQPQDSFISWGKEFQSENGLPALLQTRPFLAGYKTGGGNRRGSARPANSEIERCSEGDSLAGAWVVSVEVLEPRSDERYNASEGGYRVYNLQVEGHPSYSVKNCIVHNCGIKNKRIRVLAEELQFLPRSFIDSIANLNKNTDFKCIGSGNPKDTTDALGVLCEPAAHLGGWDGGIDQTGGTKEWETRFHKGICIQLVGTDSPNLNGKLGIPLITQEQIDSDIAFYGQDSLQFSMMDLGRMPRGQSQKRVITRQMCLKFHAMEDPVWKDDNRTRIGFLDAAYRGTGGDRTVFGELQFGAEATPADAELSLSAIVTQKVTERSNPQILAIIDTMVVPVTMNIKGQDETPEDQIAMFVKAECERRKIAPENFFFDTTGRGSLMNAFGRLWSPNVQGIEFGGKPTDRKVSGDMDIEASRYYFNHVTELWFAASYLIQAGQLRGLTEELMMEGCMREWGFTSGKLQVEIKDKMKIKSGRSCDLFDAFVCGVEGARRRGFVIKRQVAVAHKRVDHTWKKELRERAANLARSGVLDHAA